MSLFSRLFGRFLDRKQELIKAPKATYESDDIESRIFTFHVSELVKDELPYCKMDDYVNFWLPSEKPDNIYIYRSGTVGGGGKLGFVPRKYFNTIASHMNKELPIETEIIDIGANKCTIKCRLVSEAEVESQRKQEAERLKSRLIKKYSPKKGFNIKLEIPKNEKLHEGQALYLMERPIDHYLEDPYRINLEFVNENNKIVAYKQGERGLIHRILRAYFSGYEITFKVDSISRPDKYTLKYLETIEATARVDFHKQTGE